MFYYHYSTSYVVVVVHDFTDFGRFLDGGVVLCPALPGTGAATLHLYSAAAGAGVFVSLPVHGEGWGGGIALPVHGEGWGGGAPAPGNADVPVRRGVHGRGDLPGRPYGEPVRHGGTP
jgi:hypothetical protein